MPDISKINAVAIADIEKLDAVLAANIEKVNGLVFSTAPAISAPAAAYSVRLLDTAVGVPTYTGSAMRVRRDTGGTGDDDEADIAFDTSLTDPAISLDSAISNASAGVTATTLGQFLNVGTVGGTTYTNPDSLTVTASCYVDEWKDQSGNANHATQTAFGSQPQIHDGTVNTDLIQENGKPAMTFADTSDKLNISATGSGSLSLFAAAYFSMNNAWVFQADNATNLPDGIAITVDNQNSGSVNFYRSGYSSLNFTGISAGQKLVSNIFVSGTGATVGLNGSAASQDTTSKGSTAWDVSGTSLIFKQFSAGTIRAQEFVLYYSDQSSNRTGIETDINTYFSIY